MIDSTCLLCIEYDGLVRGVSAHHTRSIHLFQQAHHGRAFLAERTRAEHFRFLLSEYISDEHARRVLGDIGVGLLMSRRTKKKSSSSTVFINQKEERQRRAERIAEFTQGECLCGCGQPLLSVTRMFRQGHDTRFKSWLIKIERGDMKPDDERIPERARQFMLLLPKCKCCGYPIIDAEKFNGYGEKCFKGECGCKERDEARIKRADRLRQRSVA